MRKGVLMFKKFKNNHLKHIHKKENQRIKNDLIESYIRMH